MVSKVLACCNVLWFFYSFSPIYLKWYVFNLNQVFIESKRTHKSIQAHQRIGGKSLTPKFCEKKSDKT